MRLPQLREVGQRLLRRQSLSTSLPQQMFGLLCQRQRQGLLLYLCRSRVVRQPQQS